MSKSERLLKLHSYATNHRILSKWEEDPGAREAERILSTFRKNDLLHEHHVLDRLSRDLLDAEILGPYTISTIKGIVLLNHPPDFSETEKRFFKALSTRCPIHHVCVTGSFRLGYHGAYIDDEIKAIEDIADLPSWVPQHQIYTSKQNDYATNGVHVLSF